MPRGGRRTAAQRKAMHPYMGRPALLQRMQRVYDAHLKGLRYSEIADLEGVTVSTVYQDVKKAREFLRVSATEGLEDIKLDSVRRREILQIAAMDDRDNAQPDDATGRAALLRFAGEQQTSIEELHGLRRKDASSPTGSVFVFQVGGEQKQLQDLTDDELARVRGNLIDAEATDVSEVPEQPRREDEG